MATQTPTVSTSVLGSQANGIGTVKMVIGTVTATAQDGSVRVLQVGDKVSANEMIQTGDLASIDIEFVNGTHMDLGRNAQTVLDTDVFNPATVQPLAADMVSIQAAIDAGADPSAVAAATAAGGNVVSIQAAIAAGADPTAVAAATAAGAVAGSEGGHTFVQVDPNYAQGNVTSGFDTNVVTRTFAATEGQVVAPVTQTPAGEPPIVLPPTVSANLEGGALIVKEDGSGNFTVTANAGDATDQITQVAFGNIPAGWTVSVTGDDGGSFDAGTGVYTVSGTQQTVNLTVTATPPEDSDLDASGITITATAADISTPSLTATADTTVGFVTDAVLDQYARVGHVADEVGGQYDSFFMQEGQSEVYRESPDDQTINLGLTLNMESAGFAGSMAGGPDTDGSESVSVTVTVNAGSLVLDGYEGDATLEDNEDGSYTLTGFDGAEDLAAAVAALAVEVPAGWDGTITGSISTSAQEANTPEGTVPASGAEPDVSDNVWTDSTEFSITVNPVVLPPTVETDLDQGPLVVKEDGSGEFQVTVNAGDTTDQITQVAFANIPSDWVVTVTGTDGGSFDAGTGIYTVSGTQQTVSLTVTTTPPEDSDLDASGITITATAADISTPSLTATADATVDVVTDAVLDQYANVFGQEEPPVVAESTEDQTINLGLNLNMENAEFTGSMAGGEDTDGSESVSVTVTVNAGSLVLDGYEGDATLEDNGGGSYTLTGFAGAEDLADAVAALAVEVPAGWDGAISGAISTLATDQISDIEADYSDNARAGGTEFSITVTPVVLPPTVETDLDQGPLIVKEDGSNSFNVTANAGDATDQITQVAFGNIPAGWTVSVTGDDGGGFDTGTGIYTVSGTQQTVNLTVTATPPEDSDLDASGITITATAADISSPGLTATADATVGIVTDAVLDQYADVSATSVPDVNESASAQTIGLGLNLSMASAGFPGSMAGGVDTDGSESVSVRLDLNSALPTGASLFSTAGTVTHIGGANEYTVAANTGFSLADAVAGLKVTVSGGWDGTISGYIHSVALEVNTPQGTVPASGAEPYPNDDNMRFDSANFSVTVVDGVPKLTGSDSFSVDEDDLARGTDSIKELVSVSGTIRDNVDWGVDDFGSVTKVTVGTTEYTPTGGSIVVNGGAWTLDVTAETGVYHFTLNNNLLSPGQPGQNTVSLPAFIVTAVDDDGSPVNITLNASVVDDVPILTTTNGILTNEAGVTLLGQLVNMGADHAGSSIVLSGTAPASLTSNGEHLVYTSADSGATLLAKTTSGASVFTLHADADSGTYSMTTYQPLDLSVYNITGSSASHGGGPANVYYWYTDGTLSDSLVGTKDLLVTLTGTGGVNPSSNGIGVGNNNLLNGGETLKLNIDNEGGANGVPNLAYGTKLGLAQYDAGVDVFSITGKLVGGSGEVTLASKIVTEGGNDYLVVTAPVGQTLDYVNVSLTGDSDHKVKISSISTYTMDDAPPATLNFSFTATDADGDPASISASPLAITFQNPSTITGTDANEALAGGPGTENLYGMGGNDILVGGDGNDNLYGGGGNDVLVGGKGADTLTGGDGSDTFVYKANTDAGDTIMDFTKVTDPGADVLNVHDIFAANGIPTGVVLSQYLKVEASGSDAVVLFDKNGGGNFDAPNTITLVTLQGAGGTITSLSQLIIEADHPAV